MTFDDLGLAAPILRAVHDTGYTEPTPIQSQAIPPAMEGSDVFGCAQTGTGKTAAFTLPILHRLADEGRDHKGSDRRVKVLILTPTRELASQIGESIATYGHHLPVRHAVIYGGVGQGNQVAALRRGSDIVVACPGRLLDLMNQRLIDISRIDVFVLDEADRMLDMGFINDVRKVIAKIPTQRQALFFSATVSPEIRELAGTILHNPVNVSVTPVSSTAETVEQYLYRVGKHRKIALLKHLLKNKNMKRTLVFTRTKHGADRVAKQLMKAYVRAEAIHGNKSQNARMRALEAFKSGKARVLVASDIAARGIDIDDITHVVNYELPHEPETYVHRIGRTGRAGREGIAYSFCQHDEVGRLKQIQRLINRVIPEVEDHPYYGSHNEIRLQDGTTKTIEPTPEKQAHGPTAKAGRGGKKQGNRQRSQQGKRSAQGKGRGFGSQEGAGQPGRGRKKSGSRNRSGRPPQG